MKSIFEIVGRFLHPEKQTIYACVEVKSPSFSRIRISISLSEAAEDKTLANALINSGLKMPSRLEERRELLSTCRNEIERSLVFEAPTNTGWYKQKQFVLFDRTFGPNDPRVIHLNGTKGRITFPKIVEGEIELWKKAISKVTSKSYLSIYVLTIPFTGPLLGLKPSNVEIDVSNLMGESSTGKSLLLKLATTVYGNDSPDGTVLNFDFTDTGLEEALADSNHLFLAIDEEGLSKVEVNAGRKMLAMRLTGGTTKLRSKRYNGTPRTTFRVPISTSSNSSVKDLEAHNTNRPLAVRWFDIPVLPPEQGGIFGPHILKKMPATEISEYVKTILGQALKHQRIVGLQYLKFLTDPKASADFHNKQARAYKKFMEKHGFNLASQQVRILEKFALKYSVASALASTGLVPWTKSRGQAAITFVFNRYKELNPEGFGAELEMLKALCNLISKKSAFAKHGDVEDYHTFNGVGLIAETKGVEVACIQRQSPRVAELLFEKLGATPDVLERLLQRRNLFVKDGRNKSTLALTFSGSDDSEYKIRFMPIDITKLKMVANP